MEALTFQQHFAPMGVVQILLLPPEVPTLSTTQTKTHKQRRHEIKQQKLSVAMAVSASRKQTKQDGIQQYAEQAFNVW